MSATSSPPLGDAFMKATSNGYTHAEYATRTTMNVSQHLIARASMSMTCQLIALARPNIVRRSSVITSPVSGVQRRDDPLVRPAMGLALAGRRPAERRQDDLGQVPEVEGARAGSRALARAAGARAVAARALKTRALHHAMLASCFLHRTSRATSSLALCLVDTRSLWLAGDWEEEKIAPAEKGMQKGSENQIRSVERHRNNEATASTQQ